MNGLIKGYFINPFFDMYFFEKKAIFVIWTKLGSGKFFIAK